MKISVINGSPKTGKSTSELLIEYITRFLGQNDITVYNTGKTDLSEAEFIRIQSSEAIVFVFSLYIDSIHSRLLRFLAELKKRGFRSQPVRVYCIINNGFYEGRQNRVAADIMKNWCQSAGLTYGRTVGIGAGEMLPMLKDIPLGHGPNKNLGAAFRELAGSILSLSRGEDLFISPNWPRFLWRIQSSLYVWYPRAKKNGLKRNKLKRPVGNPAETTAEKSRYLL